MDSRRHYWELSVRVSSTITTTPSWDRPATSVNSSWYLRILTTVMISSAHKMHPATLKCHYCVGLWRRNLLLRSTTCVLKLFTLWVHSSKKCCTGIKLTTLFSSSRVWSLTEVSKSSWEPRILSVASLNSRTYNQSKVMTTQVFTKMFWSIYLLVFTSGNSWTKLLKAPWPMKMLRSTPNSSQTRCKTTTCNKSNCAWERYGCTSSTTSAKPNFLRPHATSWKTCSSSRLTYKLFRSSQIVLWLAACLTTLTVT